jgi:nucleotide-binding universal stress UspA family protein
MNPQHIVIAVPLEEKLLVPLYEWGEKFDFSHVESIQFIHVVKKNIAPLEFGLYEAPDEATFREMRPTLDKFLHDEGKRIIPSDYKGEIHYEIAKGYHPEQDVVDLLNKSKADLIVVSTRGKHGFDGLFHSSFTDYMVKFSPCDVFVVRPSKDRNRLQKVA